MIQLFYTVRNASHNQLLLVWAFGGLSTFQSNFLCFCCLPLELFCEDDASLPSPLAVFWNLPGDGVSMSISGCFLLWSELVPGLAASGSGIIVDLRYNWPEVIKISPYYKVQNLSPEIAATNTIQTKFEWLRVRYQHCQMDHKLKVILKQKMHILK